MVRFADKTQVDFVVIGGGGAGAIVAKELSAAGFQAVILERSEERRVGKECRSRWSPYH